MNSNLITYIVDSNETRYDIHINTINKIFKTKIQNLLEVECQIQKNSQCIIFAHAYDLETHSSKPLVAIKPALEAGNTVLVIYSGSGEIDCDDVLKSLGLDFPDKVCVVGRTVSQMSPLKLEDIQIVCNEIKEKSKNIYLENPNCLRQSVDYLSAFYLLCQAYLVCQSKALTKPDNSTIKEAYSLINWDDFINTEEGLAISDLLSQSSKKVQNTRWWREVFAGENYESLIDKFKEEWNNKRDFPENLDRLLRAIFAKKASLDNLELIADVFLLLSKKLGHSKSSKPKHNLYHAPNGLVIGFMQKLLQNAKIVESGVENLSVSKVLALLLGKGKNSKNVIANLAGQPLSNADRLAIIISNKHSRTQELARQLQNYRLQDEWRGAALLITSESEAKRLEAWDLFKNQRQEPTVAQICVTKPILITELFSGLSRLMDYAETAFGVMRKSWDDGSNSPVCKIQNLWHEVEQGQEKTQEICQTIIDHESSLFIHLIDHTDMRDIRRFTSSPEAAKKEDIQASLAKIMKYMPKLSLLR